MRDPRLWISVLGVALSCISLGWQAATYVLTGGRVRVQLKVGATSASGVQQVLGPVGAMSGDWAKTFIAQRFNRPVVAVEAVNIGRQPVTVTGWGLQTPNGMSLSMHDYSEVVGPPLPYTLEVGGAPAKWVVETVQLERFAHASTVVPIQWSWSSLCRWIARRGSRGVVAVVDLADGHRRYSKDSVQVGHRRPAPTG